MSRTPPQMCLVGVLGTVALVGAASLLGGIDSSLVVGRRSAFGQETAADRTSSHAIPLARALVATDGRRVDAKLAGAEWPDRLQFEVGGDVQSWDVKDVVRWGAPREATRGHGVVLSGQSLVVVDQWELDDTRFTVPTGAAAVAVELSLPRTAVRGVILNWPAEPASRDRRWRQIAAARGTQDQILLDNGDLLTGTIERTVLIPRGRAATDGGAAPRARGETAQDSPRGEASDESEPGVIIKTAAGSLNVSFDRVSAILFRGAAPAPEMNKAPHCLLGFADGTSLDVKTVRRDGERFSVTLTDDTTFESDPQWLWGDAIFVQPLGVGATYLSDLPELGFKHVPLLEREWTFGRDRNVLGQRPRHDGTTWFKGIGMHSTSRLAYDLNGDYTWFQADLAIDDAADRRGSVVFRVYVDRGEGTWQNAFESPIIRCGEALRSIQVDVRGAVRMALIVDGADWGDVGDHANWLDARLVRPRDKSAR